MVLCIYGFILTHQNVSRTIFYEVTGENLWFHVVSFLETFGSKAETRVAATIFVSKQEQRLNYSAPLIMCTYGNSLKLHINFYFSCGE